MTYTEYTHERPLYGYELNPPNPQWPNGAKIAVTFVIEYTEGAESSPEHGDEKSEALFNELIIDVSRADRDDMVESEFEYGPRAGLPRLLKMFNKYNMKGTFNVVSRALERAPYWQKVIRESGWEVACAGARWIDYMHVKPEEEDKQLREAIESVQKMKGGDGKQPMGFCVGRKSNYSQAIYAQACKDMGIPLLYSADSFADEIPFWLTSPLSPDSGLLIVPSSLDTSDFRFNIPGQGWATGADYLQYLTDTFDFMRSEGEQGMGRNMVVQLHPKIVGHGSRAYYLEQFLKYVSEQPDVWVASRAEIANHWRDKFPYDSTKAQDKVDIPKCVNPFK